MLTKRGRFLVAAVASVSALLLISGTASAVPTSQTLTESLSPAKQDKKKFGGVSLATVISTNFDNFATSQSPRQTVFTLPPDVRYATGNIPPCALSSIQNKPTALAQAACPQSITGGGSAEVNGGALKGVVTFFSGGPNTIYVHTDIGGALILDIIGTITPTTVAFTNIPNTPGNVLTKFDTVFNKRKTGKKTWYVQARCKKGKWSTTETTSFYSGETLSATATQKCKQKKSKKKK
jgi:hypothetical protein